MRTSWPRSCDHAHHRQVAGDSPTAEAVKLVARAHQSLIWDRTRQVLRLRSALREFFPAALQAFDDHRLGDAVHQWAFCAMRGSPGARAYYDTLRDRGTGHQAALHQLGNRLVGILHGCLKTGTSYDETTAWGDREQHA
jgi:hypothetical protein